MAFLRSRNQIAVVELFGTIGRAVRPELVLPLLARVREGRRFRALLLDINSPGGSAAASEELFLGVQKVSASKPVVAYVRGMGTSGALYISSAAHKIVAVRNALVGSIGVIFARPIAAQLLEKAGISFSVQKTGPHKDMFGPWRQPTPDEVGKLEGLAGEVFERFLEVVAQGRHMSIDAVRELATGEAFTSQRAKQTGLVDELGDFENALEMAGSLASVKPRPAYLRPRRRWFSMLRGGAGQEVADALMEELETAFTGRLWV